MSNTLKPVNALQLRDTIAWAAAEETTLEIIGTGSKRGLGRPLQAGHTLDLSALNGIVSYEPAELVLTARAGTTMREIDALLQQKRQILAFEPPDLGALLGGADGGTIGGVIATNLSGPRRIKVGAARDHFLGMSAVSGRGEAFKAGGKVVKDVTGYDLCKLLAGSFGTLAVMDEVTLKVLPAPEKTRTVLIFGLDSARAIAAMTEALNSPFEVSAAAHLPLPIAARSAVSYVRGAGAAVTALRIEGTAVSVSSRCEGLRKRLAACGALDELHSMNSVALWREIRDVAPLLPDAQRVIWRISVAPSEGARVATSIAAERAVEIFFDWGGGLLWIATGASEDGGVASIRGAIASSGSHATLIRAPDPLRAAVPVFEPRPGALGALSARVKSSFDPKRILNPGRMIAGV